MLNFPPLCGEIGHFAAKHGQRPLDAMPVVVSNLPGHGTILFEADFPTRTSRRTD